MSYTIISDVFSDSGGGFGSKRNYVIVKYDDGRTEKLPAEVAALPKTKATKPKDAPKEEES